MGWSRKSKKKKRGQRKHQRVGEVRDVPNPWNPNIKKKKCSFCFNYVDQYKYLRLGSLFKIDIDKKFKLINRGYYCSFECLINMIEENIQQPRHTIEDDFEQYVIDEV